MITTRSQKGKSLTWSEMDENFNYLSQKVSDKLSKADAAKVATSGSYDDLVGKPTIPSDTAIIELAAKSRTASTLFTYPNFRPVYDKYAHDISGNIYLDSELLHVRSFSPQSREHVSGIGISVASASAASVQVGVYSFAAGGSLTLIAKTGFDVSTTGDKSSNFASPVLLGEEGYLIAYLVTGSKINLRTERSYVLGSLPISIAVGATRLVSTIAKFGSALPESINASTFTAGVNASQLTSPHTWFTGV